jgi:hypothetical protein
MGIDDFLKARLDGGLAGITHVLNYWIRGLCLAGGQW